MVLAVQTPKIASRGGDGEGTGAGKKMKKGFLFNGVYVGGNKLLIHERDENTFLVLPHLTTTSFSLGDDAIVVAEEAAYVPIIKRFI